MNLLKKISLLTLTFLATSSINADAQVKEPNAHSKEHQNLLASQKPMSADIKIANTLKYLSELNRVEIPDESEVFGNYWESQSVNPYGNAYIPEVKDIDVSDYHAPVPGIMTSDYGWRPRFGRMHKGVDLNLHVGDTVRAAFSGKIRLTKFEQGGYGYYVVIRHDNGMETVYGHLSRFLVKPNQRVKAGEPIALGGNTGRSTGPHLHFETRYMGLAINPNALIDFKNKVTHKDVFTFNKSSVIRGLNAKPAGAKTTASKAKVSKSPKGKAAKKPAKRRK